MNQSMNKVSEVVVIVVVVVVEVVVVLVVVEKESLWFLHAREDIGKV